MPERIYFDTNAFHAIGETFEGASLDLGLRKKILMSPITLFEVWSQLTVTNADDILRHIHAVRNWIEPEHAGLLPWPDDALFAVWFRKPAPDDGFTEKMQRAMNTCLTEDSADRLRGEAAKLKDAIVKMKEQTVQQFSELLDAAEKKPFESDEFTDAWFKGLARRVKADPNSRSMPEIVGELSAYHEFEELKLRTALQNTDYNPAKHANDLLDAEQLIYLYDYSLCFLTCDKGFQKVSRSSQASRIITVAPSTLSDVAGVEALLRRITQSAS